MNVHILIVEDSPTQALQLKILLEAQGYGVTIAPDGKEGVAAAKKIHPTLIISDIVMPGMDGFELCKAIKQDEALKRIPVVLLTSLSDPEDLVNGLQAGADYYVTKPYDEDYLLSRLRYILANPVSIHGIEKREGLEITYAGKQHTIYADRQQILNLLLSTYENAVQRNLELIKAKDALGKMNDALEKKMQELLSSEERFRSLVLTIPDIVYRIDPQGHFTFVNDAIARLGWIPSEIVGKHFSEIILSTDIDAVSRKEVLARRQGRMNGDGEAPKLFDERRTGSRRTIGLEVRLVTKSNKLVPGVLEAVGEESITVEINSAGIYETEPSTKKKKFVGTVGVIRDITERKRMEDRVLRQGELLEGINRLFLEALRCESEKEVAKTCLTVAEELTGSKFGFVGELNSEGLFDTIAISNPGWDECKVPGSEATKLILNMQVRGVDRLTMKGGKSRIVTDMASHPDSCGFPKGHPEITSFLGVPLKQGKETTGMIALANREGGYTVADQQTVEALAVAFVEALGRKRVEMELKRHEEHLSELVEVRNAELRQSQEQLIEAEKVGALGTLTAGIAHELNNPMMGMLNFTQYCLKHIPRSDKTYSVLQDTERETKRCIDIVKNLLTFSRLEAEGEEEYQKEHITTILDRVFKLLAYRIEKDTVVITKDIAEEIPKISIKVSNLQQVFLNLVGNALDALKEREKKELHISARPDGDCVEITVGDTGCGIAPEVLKRIFDPFFTTKSQGQGTGLGLSVSRNIIKAHGGEISCRSALNKGTRFRIVLPVTQPTKVEEVV